LSYTDLKYEFSLHKLLLIQVSTPTLDESKMKTIRRKILAMLGVKGLLGARA
jgi:hypothetical protein